jgi:hypothetical protein
MQTTGACLFAFNRCSSPCAQTRAQDSRSPRGLLYLLLYAHPDVQVTMSALLRRPPEVILPPDLVLAAWILNLGHSHISFLPYLHA